MSRNSAAEGIPDPHSRAGMAFREDSHFYATKVIPPMRRAYRELGRRPVAAGVIDDVGDVYHLRFEELEAITDDGGALPASVRQLYRPLVQARAAKRRELQGIPLLDTAFLFRNRRSAEGVLPRPIKCGPALSYFRYGGDRVAISRRVLG